MRSIPSVRKTLRERRRIKKVEHWRHNVPSEQPQWQMKARRLTLDGIVQLSSGSRWPTFFANPSSSSPPPPQIPRPFFHFDRRHPPCVGRYFPTSPHFLVHLLCPASLPGALRSRCADGKMRLTFLTLQQRQWYPKSSAPFFSMSVYMRIQCLHLTSVQIGVNIYPTTRKVTTRWPGSWCYKPFAGH